MNSTTTPTLDKAIAGSYDRAANKVVYDARCYVSNNGSSWHHLMANTNGKLQVDTTIQDAAGHTVSTTESGGLYHLNTAELTTLPMNYYNQLLTNQTIFSGNAVQSSTVPNTSLSYRNNAVLAWSDNGAKTDLTGIMIYAEQGYASPIYLGTIFPIWEVVNSVRVASFIVDATKYTKYTFYNLSASTLSANCYLVIS